MKTLYFNAKFYLSRDKFAEAVLVDDGRIVFVGRTEEAKSMLMSGDVVEDLKGKTIIPGLNDSHMHLYNLGNILNTIDLRKVTSMAEMIDMCKAYVDHDAPKDRVIVGRGWNNETLLMETECQRDMI
jgi:predicted amidohydrolase YtcJ